MLLDTEWPGQVREHGPFPPADDPREVVIGSAELLQVVAGAQPGLTLSWDDPRATDPDSSLELDRADLAIPVPAGTSRAWLEWPESRLEVAHDVRLRSWARAPRQPIPPPWPRRGRSENVLISSPTGSVGAATQSTIVTEAETEPFLRWETISVPWLARWGTIVLQCTMSTLGSLSQIIWRVRTRLEDGGTQFFTEATQLSVAPWNRTDPAGTTVARTAFFACPPGPFDLSIYNGSTQPVTYYAHVFLSTTPPHRGGQV